jgi:hypothetical protein
VLRHRRAKSGPPCDVATRTAAPPARMWLWRTFKRLVLRHRRVKSAPPCVFATPDLLHLILAHVDVGTAMNVRCVSTLCLDAVTRAGLQPLPGSQQQRELQAFLLTERAAWTPQRQADLALTVSRHPQITEAMRVTLVNWLVELHYQHRTFSERCLHKIVQIVDHYTATVAVGVVGRRHYQRVGVTAFKIACLEVMGVYISMDTLTYVTDNSCTIEQIHACEGDMRAVLGGDVLTLPTPSNFLPRLFAAARMPLTLPRHVRGTERPLSPEHCVVLFFLDVAALCSDTSPLPPSLLTTAVIVGALRVLSLPTWTPQLEYYSTYARAPVHALVDRLEGAALTLQAPALEAKYQRPRWGGTDEATGVQGCWHVIAAYLDRKRAAQVPVAAAL